MWPGHSVISCSPKGGVRRSEASRGAAMYQVPRRPATQGRYMLRIHLIHATAKGVYLWGTWRPGQSPPPQPQCPSRPAGTVRVSPDASSAWSALQIQKYICSTEFFLARIIIVVQSQVLILYLAVPFRYAAVMSARRGTFRYFSALLPCAARADSRFLSQAAADSFFCRLPPELAPGNYRGRPSPSRVDS